MTAHKILLVEDEQALAMVLKDTLETSGFTVCHISTGNTAYEAYLQEKPDLLLLDVMLPGDNGFSIATKIRMEDKHTPILFLTARTMPQDVINGFTAGGNDYLKKPFDLEEMLIRIKVLLNQNRLLESVNDQKPGLAEIGRFTFDIMHQTLTYNGVARKLTAREGEVLKTLYQFRNRLLTRKNFLVQVWGDDDFFSSRSLDVYISKLRKYFKADPTIQIINHRGFGYKLIC